MSNHLDRTRVIRAALREHLPLFIRRSFMTLEPDKPYDDNWHIDHIAYHLQRVARGECRRLIINIPPRHLKSISGTIAFSAWVMGHDPSKKIISVSYAQDLSHQLALSFRNVIGSRWYGELFPSFKIDPRRQRNDDIGTTLNGRRFATSTGGSVLGQGADLIIIDDPIKPQDALSEVARRKVNEFYDNTLYTRLNDKQTGAIVIVMQRLHEDDLVGHVLQHDEWEQIVILAIETEDRAYRVGEHPDDVHWRRKGELIIPAREPMEVIARSRRILGSLAFEAQYQQNPLPQEGNIVKREWLRYYEAVPQLDLTVTSWDTASTLADSSDYSVGTVWGMRGQEIYLLEVVRGRFEVPELRRKILEVQQHRRSNAVLIEDTDIGRAIAQELRRSRELMPTTPRPRFGKIARMLAESPKIEAGQVLFPRQAPWLAEYLNELLGFPNTKHDDQVDSTSQALRWLTEKIAQGHPPIRPDPPRPLGAVRRRSGLK